MRTVAKRKDDFILNYFFGMILLAVFMGLMIGNDSIKVQAADSQEDIIDPIGKGDEYLAVLYDNTNGLPTPEANEIAETSDGAIWIGSYGGLIRYDGNTFERIDSTTGIASVVCLYVDSKDRLWVGTSDCGVAMMEQGEFRHWNKSDGLGSSFIRDIAEDTEGRIYVATSMGIVTIDDNGTVQSINDPRIVNVYMRELKMGNDGLLYGLTEKGDLFTIKSGKINYFLESEKMDIDDVICMFPDPDVSGNVYLGTSDSEIYYGNIKTNFQDMTVRDASPLSYIQEFEYFNKEIWICAGNGIGLLKEDGVQTLNNVPMNNAVNHVMADYEGNLWFTSTRQGVMKIVKNSFSDIYQRYHLSKAVVNSTCMYGDRLFIGTDIGLTVLDNHGKVSSVPLTKAQTASGEELQASDLLKLLEDCRIRSIIRDSRGRLWISTWRKLGLLCYDKGQLTTYSIQEGLFSDRIRTVFERSDGTILVVHTGGVSVIGENGVIANYGSESGIVNTESLTAVEGFHGEILLGSDGDGIYIIDDNIVKHIGTADGLTSDVVMRIKRDLTRDIFWIVTSNSIAYLDADYHVTTVQKFPYSNNFDLYQNRKDEVWILSSNGIYILPTNELLENGEIKPVYYGMANGLPCIATANSYSELTEEGNLYISGTTGVALVNIESSFENVSNLKAGVPYLDADGARIYPDENGHFKIASNVKKLTVYSFVYNYSLITPDVTYHLEGFEENHTTVSRSDLVPVSYTNLRGGEYHFVMDLSDSRGFFNKTITVTIVKEKAFYEQIWFYLVIGFVILLIFGGCIKLYTYIKTSKLEKKNRENLTFIREITEAFAKVIDMKDKYTNGHSLRVAKYTAMLAKELGCDDETIEKYYYVALLHDIGKVGVPTEVLNKPGKLTDEEFKTIQSHVTQGYEALKGINIMPELSLGAQAHHERPDGRGYPNHLKGDEIPRVAQIIAVADCFDAMYSNRPYRKRMNFEKVISIIKEVKGTQLTTDVVEAFLRLVERGEFRDPDDHGGGTTENIDNIRNSSSSGA